MGPGSNQSAEQLQQYINDMKVSSTRQGTPLNLADVQAAMSNYNAGQAPLAPNSFNPGLPPSRPPSQPPPANASAAAANATARQQLAQNQNAMAAQQQQQAEVQRQLIANQLRNPNANPNLNASGLTQQHTNGLPNLPPEMQLKIQTHYEGIKQKVARGEMTAEEASAQIKRLQDVAATSVSPVCAPVCATPSLTGACSQASHAARPANDCPTKRAAGDRRPEPGATEPTRPAAGPPRPGSAAERCEPVPEPGRRTGPTAIRQPGCCRRAELTVRKRRGRPGSESAERRCRCAEPAAVRCQSGRGCYGTAGSAGARASGTGDFPPPRRNAR